MAHPCLPWLDVPLEAMCGTAPLPAVDAMPPVAYSMPAMAGR